MNEARKRREQLAKQTEMRYEQEFYLLLNKMFKEQDRLPALEAVEEFASSWRIKLAVLKLSQGSVDALTLYIKAAQRDYSEVLNWAENPPDEEEALSIKTQLGNWLIDQGRESEGRKILSLKEKD